MASVAIILASILFIACLLKIIRNCPPKKLLRWFQSLAISPWNIRVSTNVPSSSSPSATLTPKKESNDDEKGLVEQRKMLFSTFDRNRDGFITRQELRDSLWGIRIFMSEEEVDEIIARSDRNGDGMIDFAEFCKLLEDSTMGLGSSNMQEEGEVVGGLKEAFDVFDKDGDGLISVEELASVMCSLGLISEGVKKFEDCKEMIRKVDMDGDGLVNFDEFKKMMMPAAGGKSIIAAC